MKKKRIPATFLVSAFSLFFNDRYTQSIESFFLDSTIYELDDQETAG